jgi:hypothetical protein
VPLSYFVVQHFLVSHHCFQNHSGSARSAVPVTLSHQHSAGDSIAGREPNPDSAGFGFESRGAHEGPAQML